jgi:3D (Asp-Asp-Asp) domain-containing protein
MSKIIRKFNRKAYKMYTQTLIPAFVLFATAIQMTFPQMALAIEDISVITDPSTSEITNIITEPDWNYSIRLPEPNERTARYTVNITVTAYNSLPWQTDDTPCIAASGMDVCERNAEDIIATNFAHLPFGTRVKLPDLYGDRVFRVEDRMNKRYNQRADIWMKEYSDAKSFGKRWTRMEVF